MGSSNPGEYLEQQPELLNLLVSMLNSNPELRPDIHQVIVDFERAYPEVKGTVGSGRYPFFAGEADKDNSSIINDAHVSSRLT